MVCVIFKVGFFLLICFWIESKFLVVKEYIILEIGFMFKCFLVLLVLFVVKFKM